MTIDQSVIWIILFNLLAIAFGAGYVRYQVLANMKDNQQLRQELRDHMANEAKVLVEHRTEEHDQYARLLEVQSKQLEYIMSMRERLARIEAKVGIGVTVG